MNDINLTIFEDVDVTMTTKVVKKNILNGYSGRLVLACMESTLELAKSQTSHDYDVILHKNTMNICQSFIKWESPEKMLAVYAVYNAIKSRDNAQAIVFCQVSTIHWVNKFQILFEQ